MNQHAVDPHPTILQQLDTGGPSLKQVLHLGSPFEA